MYINVYIYTYIYIYIQIDRYIYNKANENYGELYTN